MYTYTFDYAQICFYVISMNNSILERQDLLDIMLGEQSNWSIGENTIYIMIRGGNMLNLLTGY